MEMATTKGWLKVGWTEKTRQISGGGFWTIDQLSELQPAVDGLQVDGAVATDIDFHQIERMDTAGACLAAQLLDRLEVDSPEQVHSNQRVDSILKTVTRYKRTVASDPVEANVLVKLIERIGKATLDALDLTADVLESGRFMTLFYLSIRADLKSLEWVRAGHDPAMIYDPTRDTCEDLKGPGVALGFDPDYRYQSMNRDGIRDGNIIAIGTDGIWKMSMPVQQLRHKHAECTLFIVDGS